MTRFVKRGIGMSMKLLTRDAFRDAVFTRDGHRCVFCKRAPEDTPEGKLDAHHIIERKLWSAEHERGGYFLDNGATVCEDCHLKCEQTIIPLDKVRENCGIDRVILPDFLYEDQEYDKWGNIIMSNRQRLRGPLFYDESVQKVLREGRVLDCFSKYVKHPRLPHLPWSPGMNDDDRHPRGCKNRFG